MTYISAFQYSNLIPKFLKNQIFFSKIPIGNNYITPLLASISIKNTEISEILIDKNLNINDSTDIRYTPLHFSAFYNLPKITKLLLNKGANDNLKTKLKEETPLYLACKEGNFEIVEVLTNNNRFNINEKSADNKTSLHLVSINSLLSTQILVKKNANLKIKDNNKRTPCELALIYGRDDIFNYLGCTDNDLLTFYKNINQFNNNNWNFYLNNNINDIKILCKFMKKMI